MLQKAQITYREFYDVPRMIIFIHCGLKLLLDCRFDESLDEYSATYKVYTLPHELDEHVLDSWIALPEMASRYIGEIPVDQVTFDPSNRAEIHTGVIERLLART